MSEHIDHRVLVETYENRSTFTVVDMDGYPVNHGHFSVKSDAEYVCSEMDTGKYNGDSTSNLCRSMDSWIP